MRTLRTAVLTLTALLVPPLLAGAAEWKPYTPQSEIRRQVEEIRRGNLDNEAMEWAWRIAGVKDLGYEELEDKSHRWSIDPGVREELFRRIKKILDAGKARPLSAAEKAATERARDQMRIAEGRGPSGTPEEDWPLTKAVEPLERENLDLNAMYTAWAIAGEKETDYEQLEALWGGERASPGERRLLDKIKAILDSGGARPLTPEESKRFNDINDKIRAIRGMGPIQDTEESRLHDKKLEAMDRLDKQNLELEARYWAWRIARVKNIGLEELRKKSLFWVMKLETRQALMARVRALLDSGGLKELDASERSRLEQYRREVRLIGQR